MGKGLNFKKGVKGGVLAIFNCIKIIIESKRYMAVTTQVIRRGKNGACSPEIITESKIIVKDQHTGTVKIP